VRLAGFAALLGALVVATGAGAAGLPASDEFAEPATGVPTKLKAKYLHGRARLKKLLPYLER
jgi:hypothetical protein